MYFIIGDYLAGMLIGSLTALGVRGLVAPGTDMVVGMLLGTLVGTGVHVILGSLLMPLLGMFATMIPTMVVGMYSGMLFGMRDAMAAGSPTLGSAAWVGALLGAVIVLALKAYDRTLRGTVIDAGE
jgi:hypothetical protein